MIEYIINWASIWKIEELLHELQLCTLFPNFYIQKYPHWPFNYFKEEAHAMHHKDHIVYTLPIQHSLIFTLFSLLFLVFLSFFLVFSLFFWFLNIYFPFHIRQLINYLGFSIQRVQIEAL